MSGCWKYSSITSAQIGQFVKVIAKEAPQLLRFHKKSTKNTVL